TPKFFLHWFWRMMARLGLSEVGLRSNKLAHARSNADDFLESSLTTADPYLQALAWELQSRISIAEQNSDRAEMAVQKALKIVEGFEIPIVAWQVHATAWDLYRKTGDKEKANGHLELSASSVLRIANSFLRDEPLRETFLKAAPVQRIMD